MIQGQDGNGYRLRLFLAADLQNSTALKFRFSCDGNTFWRRFLTGFYIEFSTTFLTVLGDIMGRNRQESWNPPGIWKCSGDEVIMVVESAPRSHLKFYIQAFRDAVREYNQKLEEMDPEVFRVGGETLRMRLKPRAWLADFPINNMELETPQGVLKLDSGGEKPWTENRSDFLGPAIDVGFRLGGLATSRKFVLAVEVVWALLEEDGVPSDFRLFMEGRVSLKGVRGGEPYPIFWLDLEVDAPKEDEWVGLRELTNRDHKAIKQVCQSFIGMEQNPLYRPIFNDEKLPSVFVDAMYRMKEM